MPTPDLEFFFDPSCPFCWVTSKWVRVVQREAGIEVRWSYISLRTLNEPYEDEGQEAWHMTGRRTQRVIAAAAAAHGDEVIGPLYEAIGDLLWEVDGPEGYAAISARVAEGPDVEAALERVGLPTGLAAAAEDDSWDHLFEAATKEALSRTGEDVGTPIITFDPDGDDPSSFFGPVISEVPSPADSVTFYRALEAAARIPGFSELKRTKRDQPQLPMLGGLG